VFSYCCDRGNLIIATEETAHHKIIELEQTIVLTVLAAINPEEPQSGCGPTRFMIQKSAKYNTPCRS